MSGTSAIESMTPDLPAKDAETSISSKRSSSWTKSSEDFSVGAVEVREISSVSSAEIIEM